MITLAGMRLNQKGNIIYLTSVTIEDLKKWVDNDYISADIWKRDRPEGYQRMPDSQRAQKIAEYIEGKLKIEDILLPNTVILNIRQKGLIDFEPLSESKKRNIETGIIKIRDEATPFYEVDGQHRVRGLIEALTDKDNAQDIYDIKSFPIPVTIMEGLDRPSEAIQFVVINTTQKKVNPDLVLRILHKRYRDKSEKLEFFLKGQTWRLFGIEICDQLNNDTNSPWLDRIIAQGDPRQGRVASEQNFVNSLETVYPKLDPDTIKTYLPLYWRAISSLWPECIGDTATKYSLQRTNGINVFHWMFPFIYFKCVSLGNVKLQGFIDSLKPVRKKYPPDFWKRGGAAKGYTSRAAQSELTDLMIAVTLPSGRQIKLNKWVNDTGRDRDEHTWKVATKMIPLRYFNLFSQERLRNIDSGATGVYVFYSFTHAKFYVGRADKADLKSRLQTHFQNKANNKFHIFNYKLCKEPTEAHDMECALFHLLPTHLLMNKEHPSALGERKCPFCTR